MNHSQFSGIVAVVVLLAIGFAPHSFYYGATDWERVYLPNSARLLTGESIFQDAFVYPPFAAVLGLPSIGLPSWAVRVLFWLMNVVCGSVLIIASWNLAGGRFSLRPPKRELIIAGLGLATALGFTFDVMVNRQTDLVVGAFTIGGCWLLLRQRGLAGTLSIGFAAAIKCTPLLFVPYLAFVGRWRAAVGVFVVAIGANLAVDVVFPPKSDQIRFVEWTQQYLLPLGKVEPGKWHSAIGFNHSLSGIVNRSLRVNLVPHENDWTETLVAPAPSKRIIQLVVYGTGAGLLLIACFALWSERNSGTISPIGIGMTLCLMLLLSPMSSKPHFCVMVLPAWVVARSAMERQRFSLLLLSGIAAVCGLVSNKDLLGGWAYGWLIWHGTIPAMVLLLFAGLAIGKQNKTVAGASG